MRTLVLVFFLTIIPFCPFRIAQASSDAITPYPVVVLEKTTCMTAFLEKSKFLVGRLGWKRFPFSDNVLERFLINITVADDHLNDFSAKYVNFLVPELAWFVKTYGHSSRVGRLAQASLDAFEAKMPSISTAQARAYVRAQMGNDFNLNGDEPPISQRTFRAYFKGFVRHNIVHCLGCPESETQKSAMLFIQALMTEAQLRILGAYGPVRASSRADLEEVWRQYEQIMAEE